MPSATFPPWPLDLLEHSGARSYAMLLNAALVWQWNEFSMTDAHAQAFAASVERLKDTDQQGRVFCEKVETV